MYDRNAHEARALIWPVGIISYHIISYGKLTKKKKKQKMKQKKKKMVA